MTSGFEDPTVIGAIITATGAVVAVWLQQDRRQKRVEARTAKVEQTTARVAKNTETLQPNDGSTLHDAIRRTEAGMDELIRRTEAGMDELTRSTEAGIGGLTETMHQLAKAVQDVDTRQRAQAELGGALIGKLEQHIDDAREDTRQFDARLRDIERGRPTAPPHTRRETRGGAAT